MRFATRRCGSASMPWASRRPTWRPRRATSACSGWANFSRPAGRATWVGWASAPLSAPIRKPCGADAKTVVSLAINYAPPSDPLEVLKHDERAAISVYAQGRDYHEVMKSKLKALGRFIWDTYRHDLKVFVDTAPLMEKPAAQAVGHGWQGKHTNLVSRQFGSWLFLGEILLSVELPADQPETDHCGQCRACLDICPTNAFPAPYRLEARRCISYLTIEHEGPIDRELQAAARQPHLRLRRLPGGLPVEQVRPGGARDRADAAAGAQRAVARRACDARRRRLPQALRRHRRSSASAATGSCGTSPMRWATATARATALPAVERLLGDPSPLVRGAAVWALSRLAPHQVAQRQRAADEDDPDVRAEWQDALQTARGRENGH